MLGTSQLVKRAKVRKVRARDLVYQLLTRIFLQERYLQATLQVTYSLSWSHFNNNCEGFNPQLEFSCSEGGLISILDIDNRLTDDPSCVLIDNSGVLCSPSYDASINDGLIVDVDFIFACTGSSQAQLHASAVSAGQNLV